MLRVGVLSRRHGTMSHLGRGWARTRVRPPPDPGRAHPLRDAATSSGGRCPAWVGARAPRWLGCARASTGSGPFLGRLRQGSDRVGPLGGWTEPGHRRGRAPSVGGQRPGTGGIGPPPRLGAARVRWGSSWNRGGGGPDRVGVGLRGGGIARLLTAGAARPAGPGRRRAAAAASGADGRRRIRLAGARRQAVCLQAREDSVRLVVARRRPVDEAPDTINVAGGELGAAALPEARVAGTAAQVDFLAVSTVPACEERQARADQEHEAHQEGKRSHRFPAGSGSDRPQPERSRSGPVASAPGSEGRASGWSSRSQHRAASLYA